MSKDSLAAIAAETETVTAEQEDVEHDRVHDFDGERYESEKYDGWS